MKNHGIKFKTSQAQLPLAKWSKKAINVYYTERDENGNILGQKKYTCHKIHNHKPALQTLPHWKPTWKELVEEDDDGDFLRKDVDRCTLKTRAGSGKKLGSGKKSGKSNK